MVIAGIILAVLAIPLGIFLFFLVMGF